MRGWLPHLWTRMSRHPVRLGLILIVLGIATYAACWQVVYWRHFFAARRALEDGDFAAASRELKRCLDGWPGSASTHLLAARSARRAGDRESAQSLLTRAQQLGASAEDVVLERYLLRALDGELAEVEAKLIAFLHKDHPESVLILEVLTQQWMHDFRLEEARTHLERWLSIKPDEREAMLRLGWVLERLGQNSAAIIHYQRALDLDQDQGNGDPVRLRLAELLIEQKEPLQAKQHLDRLQGKSAETLQAAVAAIRTAQLLGKSAEATESLEKLMRQWPADPRLLLERGRLHLELNQSFEAEPFLRAAEKQMPYNRQVVFLLVRCLKNLNKREALGYEKRLLEIRADEKKMRELMVELTHSPKDAWLHFQIGEIFLRNGFVQDGERSLLTALRYDPKHQPAQEALALHFEKIGQPERASSYRGTRAPARTP